MIICSKCEKPAKKDMYGNIVCPNCGRKEDLEPVCDFCGKKNVCFVECFMCDIFNRTCIECAEYRNIIYKCEKCGNELKINPSLARRMLCPNHQKNNIIFTLCEKCENKMVI